MPVVPKPSFLTSPEPLPPLNTHTNHLSWLAKVPYFFHWMLFNMRTLPCASRTLAWATFGSCMEHLYLLRITVVPSHWNKLQVLNKLEDQTGTKLANWQLQKICKTKMPSPTWCAHVVRPLWAFTAPALIFSSGCGPKKIGTISKGGEASQCESVLHHWKDHTTYVPQRINTLINQ